VDVIADEDEINIDPFFRFFISIEMDADWQVETGEFWTGFQDFQGWQDLVVKTKTQLIAVFKKKTCQSWKSWNPV
jgi:hypothetical protein